jgi:hypothetical protein
MDNTLKTDGVNLAGIVKTQANLGELGLKDGQNIVGRIISIITNEVVLQLAGKTITAQLEGRPLLPGTLVLFGVALAESGKVELKVLTNLTQQATETPSFSGDAGLKNLIGAVCHKLGWEGTSVQIEQIYHDLQLFAAKYGQTLPPEVFVWLRTQNWPITPGTILLAWLYQDQELRNLVWTRLRWNMQLKQQSDLLPQVWDLDNLQSMSETILPGELTAVLAGGEPADGQPCNAMMKSDRIALTDSLLRAGSKTESKSGWEQLQPLLEKSLNLDQAIVSPANHATTVLPFLIHTKDASIKELRIKWSTKPKSGADSEREELLRMVIPTENLGDIHLSVLLSPTKTRINFKVGSMAVQEYLNRNLADLKSLMNNQTYIVVGVTTVHDTAEMKVDLWM